MIVKTGMTPTVDLFHGNDTSLLSIRKEDMTLDVPLHVDQGKIFWVVTFKDPEARTVKGVYISFTEPHAEKKSFSLLLSREVPHNKERWEHELNRAGAPQDALIERHPDEWSDTERKTATWWEVEL